MNDTFLSDNYFTNPVDETIIKIASSLPYRFMICIDLVFTLIAVLFKDCFNSKTKPFPE